MANPYNDAAAERSNKRVLAKARAQAADPSRAEQEAERRARLEQEKPTYAPLVKRIAEAEAKVAAGYRAGARRAGVDNQDQATQDLRSAAYHQNRADALEAAALALAEKEASQ